ncbi:MAG: YgiQ family radical SAM protein [Nitrospinae bacterium]|nr:YgiQ family radical SAM protein [Nitrospinota bacterium]
MASNFLPTTPQEANARGWNQLDVILVTGDAYVDHPSFGVAVVGRFLESLGVRVGIIAMPDVEKPEDFTRLGAPAWFFGVTAGNLDSMLMRATASRKHRSDDDYAPGGKAGLRPKRAAIAYCNKLRELFHDSQILIGGLEASLRRHAHYDYWDNKVRRSMLLDSRADLLAFGMAERPLAAIVEAVRRGKRLKELKDIHGTAAMISLSERKELGDEAVTLPSYEEVSVNKIKYARASCIIHDHQNPWSGKTLVQKHGNRYVRVNPPALPLTTKELDAVHALPFTREPHPSYKERVPAFEMIRFSVTAMRGCFGGCAFCALTVHQGKAIQSRSVKSVEEEVKQITRMKGFTGYVSDVGGPTANMYMMGCLDSKAESACRKLSCVFPNICRRLGTDHSPQIEMLRKASVVKGVKKVFVASGVRYDLANLSPEYIRELARNHVSGQLKVAPEHCHPKVLAAMRKPPIEEFEKFEKRFAEESKNAKLDQYLVPYFISAHPGCGLEEQIALAEYLKSHNMRPRQAQEFIPLPLTLAGDMYYTGIDPMTGSDVAVAKGESDRKLQRALMQYFKPENREMVNQAMRIWQGRQRKKSATPQLP